MDRIDELTEQLIQDSESVSFWTNRYSALLNTTTGVDDKPLDKAYENLQGYTGQRDALRQQIADEYRDLLAALELALEWLDSVCEEDFELGGEPEGIEAKRQIIAALARARGE